MDEFTEKDYWRMIILYGMNSSTYKLALDAFQNLLTLR